MVAMWPRYSVMAVCDRQPASRDTSACTSPTPSLRINMTAMAAYGLGPWRGDTTVAHAAHAAVEVLGRDQAQNLPQHLLWKVVHAALGLQQHPPAPQEPVVGVGQGLHVVLRVAKVNVASVEVVIVSKHLRCDSLQADIVIVIVILLFFWVCCQQADVVIVILLFLFLNPRLSIREKPPVESVRLCGRAGLGGFVRTGTEDSRHGEEVVDALLLPADTS
ncbi:hypothetical protein EYF80_053732 [Liparis tanakae]|uniref:Uncharacterized protein n=1 Tax=Liparis tanakae TaxID=230148 RepID=A0A4Z2F5S6_9TELE|nr:hypothetical protein EYF80_053732 [Liparis tanakae]